MSPDQEPIGAPVTEAPSSEPVVETAPATAEQVPEAEAASVEKSPHDKAVELVEKFEGYAAKGGVLLKKALSAPGKIWNSLMTLGKKGAVAGVRETIVAAQNTSKTYNASKDWAKNTYTKVEDSLMKSGDRLNAAGDRFSQRVADGAANTVSRFQEAGLSAQDYLATKKFIEMKNVAEGLPSNADLDAQAEAAKAQIVERANAELDEVDRVTAANKEHIAAKNAEVEASFNALMNRRALIDAAKQERANRGTVATPTAEAEPATV